LEAGRRQPDPPGDVEDDEATGAAGGTAAETRLVAMFQRMLQERDKATERRFDRMEKGFRDEMVALARSVKPEGTGGDGAAGGVPEGAGATTGPLLKVPATTLPPPKLEFVQTPAKFDTWYAAWTAYLETSGVKSIADSWARLNRTRSLLQQAFDEDMGTWVMRQAWYRDPAINTDAARVLERIREKINQEADPRNALAALMRRKWSPGETVDSFWLDIQTQVQYCGLRDEYHTDLILTTVWSNNFGDDETRKEFALNPKWTAIECYQRAKGLEQVRKERRGELSVNVVRQSAYKKGGGKAGGKVVASGKGAANSGGNTGPQKSGVGAGTRSTRAASCLNCGFDSHRNGVCPAQGQTCKACGTVGHYAKHCPVANINAVVVDDVEELRVCNAIQIADDGEDDDGDDGVHEETVTTVTDSRPPAARKPQTRDWQEVEYEVGNRCEVRDGDRWIPGTITGSFVANNGPRICAVLLDESNEIWKMTTDNVVIRKRAEKGHWVPVKQPVNGRGPRK
jgi:hypothetical protein